MNDRGQALIESIPFFMVLFGIIGALLNFTQWFLIHQKLLIAAREGAMLYSSGRFRSKEVERRLRSYLEHGSLALKSTRLHIEIGRWQGPQEKLFHLDEIKVVYTPSSRLQLYFTKSMEEKCVIKHAPHYVLPFQTRYGPPERW